MNRDALYPLSFTIIYLENMSHSTMTIVSKYQQKTEIWTKQTLKSGKSIQSWEAKTHSFKRTVENQLRGKIHAKKYHEPKSIHRPELYPAKR